METALVRISEKSRICRDVLPPFSGLRSVKEGDFTEEIERNGPPTREQKQPFWPKTQYLKPNTRFESSSNPFAKTQHLTPNTRFESSSNPFAKT